MKRINRNLTTLQTFRISQEEKMKLKSYAEEHNLSVTEVLRNFVASLETHNPYDKILYGGGNVKAMTKLHQMSERTKLIHLATEKTIIFYLSTIANNVNQIAKWANTYKSQGNAEAVITALNALKAEMGPIKQEIADTIEDEKLKQNSVIEEYVQDVDNENAKQKEFARLAKLLARRKGTR